MSIKLNIKTIFTDFVSLFGILNIFQILKSNNGAFVLMYHRVVEPKVDDAYFVQPGMYVLADTFRNQIEFLKHKFEVIPLDDLVERLAAGKRVDGCCSITFDDGWLDNYQQAFPVLKELQVPATVFLATGFIGTTKIFWPEELCFYLKQPDVWDLIERSEYLKNFVQQVPGEKSDPFYFDNAIETLKLFTPDDRENVLNHLRSFKPDSNPERLLMGWDEVMEMKESGLITFGAHTVSHVILSQVSTDKASEEILNSIVDMEIKMSLTPTCFAYPNGNFTEKIKGILKQKGIKGAVTTQKGWIDEKVDLYEIPRIGIHEDVSSTIPLFWARILWDRF